MAAAVDIDRGGSSGSGSGGGGSGDADKMDAISSTSQAAATSSRVGKTDSGGGERGGGERGRGTGERGPSGERRQWRARRQKKGISHAIVGDAPAGTSALLIDRQNVDHFRIMGNVTWLEVEPF